MSILKYFHTIEQKDQERDQEDNAEIKSPNPDRDLSKVVPSKAIHAANQLIEQILEPKRVRMAPYIFLTPAQGFAIGKRAVENMKLWPQSGITLSIFLI